MSASDNRQWWMSTREEGSYSGPFDTREEAVAELLAEQDGGFVGYSGPLPWPKTKAGRAKLIDGTRTLESIGEDVCGELGSEHPEHEDWLTFYSRADEDDLEEALNAALWAWMDKHGLSIPTVICGVKWVDRREERAPKKLVVVDAGPHDGTCDRGCGRPPVMQERITSGANAPLANVCDNSGCDENHCEKKSSSGAECEYGHIHSPPCSFEEAL